MSRRVKLPSKGGHAAGDSTGDFFAGVDEMRAHVDRHSRDPERRRARLARIAEEMPRHRQQPLSAWLVAELRQAMAARACTLLRRDGGWSRWSEA
ncbi:MAG: hypothetical protein HYZ27_12545, partial [Deltaproteobacteria bacterium]|nr:hypothetical protein [Deltaproteobacteria bacterium]